MKHIKGFNKLFESIWETIDLQKEFDDINNQAFDGKLKPVKLQFDKRKSAGGGLHSSGRRDRHGRLYDEVPKFISISTYYDKTYQEFRDTLAHEMIHLYIMQNKIQDDNYHGLHFKDKMKELNDKGFKVTLKDDVKNVELSDKTPLKKEMAVIVVNYVTDGKILLSILDVSQITDENIKKILDTIAYTSKVNRNKYEFSVWTSNYYLLGRYTTTRKFKDAHSLKYYDIADKYEEFKENSKFITGWKIDAGTAEHFNNA